MGDAGVLPFVLHCERVYILSSCVSRVRTSNTSIGRSMLEWRTAAVSSPNPCNLRPRSTACTRRGDSFESEGLYVTASFSFSRPPRAGFTRFAWSVSSQPNAVSWMHVGRGRGVCVIQVLPSVRGVRVLPSGLRVHALQYRLSASSGEKEDGVLDEGSRSALPEEALSGSGGGSGRWKRLDRNAPRTVYLFCVYLFSVGTRLAPCASLSRKICLFFVWKFAALAQRV